MEKDQILNQLTAIFRDILDDDSIILTGATTAKDVEDWDSLNNIQLVVAIEKRFGIRFNAAEIQSWKNVNEMIDSIQAKL